MFAESLKSFIKDRYLDLEDDLTLKTRAKAIYKSINIKVDIPEEYDDWSIQYLLNN